MADYKWATFAYKVPAQKVGERIEQLSRSGSVTAAAIVDDARAEDSPMHPIFEWDDTEAAELYRQHQAKVMLSSLSITVTGGQAETKAITVRAFSNAEKSGYGKTAVYVSTAAAMQSEEQRSVILDNALRELEACRSKYATLSELTELFEELARQIAEVRKKESRPRSNAKRQTTQLAATL